MKDRSETQGDFSQYELLTNDIEGGKRFHREALGWGMEESPNPPDRDPEGRFCTFQDPQGAVLSAIAYEREG